MKVGLYCRVSSLSQKENSSLENQKILGIEFSKRFEYEYEIFEDVESGGKLNRKEFSRLLKLCKSGEINGIWVYDNDRLSRDYDVGGDIRKIILEYDLRLFIGFEEVRLSESRDRFEYNIRSVMSDYERERIVERMYYGKIRKYKEGKGLGIVGFGYEKNKDGYVVINEEESEIVKEIYNLFLRKDVKYYSDVERKLESKYGKVINGKRLNGGIVERVLGSEKYLGKVYKEDKEGNRYEFNIGRIIDDEIMTEVKRKKELMKGFRKGNVKENYLLKGKVKCGDCGGSMWVRRGGKVIKGKLYGYYYCNDKERKKKYDKKFDRYVIKENKFKKNKKIDLKEYEKMYGKFRSCGSVKENVISIEKLEELVWYSLYDFLKKSDKIKKEYKIRYNKNLGEKDKFSGKLKYYNKELEKWEDRKFKMYNSWLDGKINDKDKDKWESESEIKVSGIKGKINKIKNELKKFDVVNKIDSYVDLMEVDLKNEFNVERFEDKRRIIEKYVERIDVKLLELDNKKRDYEIKVKLYFEDDSNDNELNSFKFKVNNFINKIYKLKNVVAEKDVLVYKNEVEILMIYRLKIYNIGRCSDKSNKSEMYLVDFE